MSKTAQKQLNFSVRKSSRLLCKDKTTPSKLLTVSPKTENPVAAQYYEVTPPPSPVGPVRTPKHSDSPEPEIINEASPSKRISLQTSARSTTQPSSISNTGRVISLDVMMNRLRSPRAPVNALSPPSTTGVIASLQTSPCPDRTILASFCTPSRRLNFDSSPRKRLISSQQQSPSLPISPWKHLTISGDSPQMNKTEARSPRKMLYQQRHPVVQRADATVYQEIKKALQTTQPDVLIGRDKEISDLKEFIVGHSENHTSASLYISGPPGTGKTAVISHVLKEIKNGSFKTIFINCMSFKDSTAIFSKIASDVSGKNQICRSPKDAVLYLTKHFCSSNNIVLVLDEIDQLDSRRQEILYTMFEWPSIPKSKLILIGIANSLDLTDRMLPRLQVRPKHRPKLMHFQPYSKDQIMGIIDSRLSQVSNDQGPVLESSAIQFCARKVSAVAGDIRRALNVCHRAVEIVEKDVKSQSVLRTAGCPGSPIKTTPSKRPPIQKVGIKQISNVLCDTDNTTQSSLPLQQKLVVCSLIVLLNRTKHVNVTFGKLHESYIQICKKQQLNPVDQSEFLNLCSLVEDQGFLSMKRSKDIRQSKIILKSNQKELEHVLQDQSLISNIIRI